MQLLNIFKLARSYSELLGTLWVAGGLVLGPVAAKAVPVGKGRWAGLIKTAVAVAVPLLALLSGRHYLLSGRALGVIRRCRAAQELWLRRQDVLVASQVEAAIPTALVTGCTSGLGRETCIALLACGWRVILTGRDTQSTEEARRLIVAEAKERLRRRWRRRWLATAPSDSLAMARCDVLHGMDQRAIAIALDLSNAASIRGFVASLGRHVATRASVSSPSTPPPPPLRLLVNNAGTFIPNATPNSDGVDTMFMTNYLGPVLLTRLLLQQTPRNSSLRVINVSSIAHLTDIPGSRAAGISPEMAARNYLAALTDPESTYRNNPLLAEVSCYGFSKLALNAFTHALAKEQIPGLSSFALHPGAVNTPVFRRLGRYSPIHLLKMLFFKSADEGAALQLFLSLAPIRPDEMGSHLSPMSQPEHQQLEALLPLPFHTTPGVTPLVRGALPNITLNASDNGAYFTDAGPALTAPALSWQATPETYKVINEWTSAWIAKALS